MVGAVEGIEVEDIPNSDDEEEVACIDDKDEGPEDVEDLFGPIVGVVAACKLCLACVTFEAA